MIIVMWMTANLTCIDVQSILPFFWETDPSKCNKNHKNEKQKQNAWNDNGSEGVKFDNNKILLTWC